MVYEISDYLYYTCLAYGCWKLLKVVLHLLYMIYKYLLMQLVSNNLYLRYGSMNKRSWVLVTGATDGIGKAMCKVLASKYKFDIVMVGRNKEKLEKVS